MPAAPPHLVGPTRRSMTALVVATLLFPVLAGCGTEDGGRATATGHARDIRTAPRDQLREGGTLRWAVDALPPTLNAFQVDATPVTDRVAGATLPALFTVDARGRSRMNSDYLESAEVTERDGQQTVVYRLRPRARWSDGRPLGVQDFRAQWRALNSSNDAYQTARTTGYDRIQEVGRGDGPRDVKITFARPYADWRSLFSPLYPRTVTGGPDAFNEGARTRLRTAGGPFLVRRVDRDAGTLTLRRNPRWWGDRAKLDRIVLTAWERGRRVAALATGRLGLAEIAPADARRIEAVGEGGHVPASAAAPLPRYTAIAGQPPGGPHPVGPAGGPAAEERRAAAGRGPRPTDRDLAASADLARRLGRFAVRRAFAPTYTHLAVNGAMGPLADQRVRRAIGLAIDRQRLARRALAPAGLPAKPLGSHLHMLDQDGYRDSSGALGDGRDLAAARRLLADAGQASGDGRQPLRLRFVLPAGSDARALRSTGKRIARMLDDIGVQVRLRTVDDAAYLRDVVAAGDFDLALYSWPASPFPATDARPIYAKPEVAPGGTLLVEQNYSRVGTDHINQLFDQAAGELDGDEHRALLRRADARIWAAAGSLPLYQRPQLVAVRSDLANAGAFGMETPRYQDIGFLAR